MTTLVVYVEFTLCFSARRRHDTTKINMSHHFALYPPFHNIVALNDNRFFVQTYEVSEEGAFIYDIYSPEGIYVRRVELEGVPVAFYGENTYCLHEKASGYNELVVYKMSYLD